MRRAVITKETVTTEDRSNFDKMIADADVLSADITRRLRLLGQVARMGEYQLWFRDPLVRDDLSVCGAQRGLGNAFESI
jgi:hypothetical protein